MSDSKPEISFDTYVATRDDALTLDVREQGEYVAGHVPGALLVPMSRLANRLGELDKSRRIHVICASGNRSLAMADLLVASGFDAVSVAGGTQAWISSGRPVETGL